MIWFYIVDLRTIDKQKFAANFQLMQFSCSSKIHVLPCTKTAFCPFMQRVVVEWNKNKNVLLILFRNGIKRSCLKLLFKFGVFCLTKNRPFLIYSELQFAVVVAHAKMHWSFETCISKNPNGERNDCYKLLIAL